MKNLRKYDSKYDYINKFFLFNNIILMLADTNKRNKVMIYDFHYDEQKYICIISSNKMSSKKRFELIKELVFNISDERIESNYLYVNKRYKIDAEIFLSKKINIKMNKIDNKTKNMFVTYNYFKIKDLINRQGYGNFYKQYKSIRKNELLNKIYYKIKKNIITGTVDEYLYIGTIKNIIHIYSKEIDKTVDYNDPSFNDNMLFKYLDNYFDKFVIINYSKEEVKNFISKYYISESQSEDLVYSFVNEFIIFYQMITNNKFFYENSHNFNLKNLTLFNYKKASDIKYKKFYKYFDSMLDDDKNYYNFMFLLEILELTKHNSDKKNIINFVSIFEILLVKGDKNISYQIQNKIIKLLNNNYSKNEFKLIYEYRSKIIHGDYKKSIYVLKDLLLIKKNEITVDEIQNDTYSNIYQLLDKRIKKEMFNALVILLRYFVFKNKKIKFIKNSAIIF